METTKYTSRSKKNGSTIICSEHRRVGSNHKTDDFDDGKQEMVDLGRNGKCVGAGCHECYKDLKVKELSYE